MPVWCQLIADLQGLSMSADPQPKPYREAILSDAEGNLKKVWVVNYYAWSEKKQALVRKRSTFDQPTKEERYRLANEFITAINLELKEGAVLDAIEVEESDSEITPKTSLKKATEYFTSRKGKTVDEETLRSYKKDIRGFMAWAELKGLEQMAISKFSTAQVYLFADHLDGKVWKKKDKAGNEITKVGLAKKTFSNYIATMRTMWFFLMERKVIGSNPWMDIKKRKGASGQHIPYSPAQVMKFKKVCLDKLGDEQMWLFANFIYYGFFRPRKEAQKLQVKHILKRTIIVPGDIAKNNESEHVRIPKGLEALIEHYKIREYPSNYYVFSIEKQPGPVAVGINHFYERNKKILDLAGLTDQDYDLYSWKHTGNIALYLATKDIKLIQLQNRHKDINTTDIYLRSLGLFLDENAFDLFPDPGTDL